MQEMNHSSQSHKASGTNYITCIDILTRPRLGPKFVLIYAYLS